MLSPSRFKQEEGWGRRGREGKGARKGRSEDRVGLVWFGGREGQGLALENVRVLLSVLRAIFQLLLSTSLDLNLSPPLTRTHNG